MKRLKHFWKICTVFSAALLMTVYIVMQTRARDEGNRMMPSSKLRPISGAFRQSAPSTQPSTSQSVTGSFSGSQWPQTTWPRSSPAVLHDQPQGQLMIDYSGKVSTVEVPPGQLVQLPPPPPDLASIFAEHRQSPMFPSSKTTTSVISPRIVQGFLHPASQPTGP